MNRNFDSLLTSKSNLPTLTLLACVDHECKHVAACRKHSVRPHCILKRKRFSAVAFVIDARPKVAFKVIDLIIWRIGNDAPIGPGCESRCCALLLGKLDSFTEFPVGLTIKLVSSDKDSPALFGRM
jgi:hypothetical protein